LTRAGPRRSASSCRSISPPTRPSSSWVDGYANLSNVAGAFEFSIGPGCVPTCGTLADDACGEASDGCGGGCACSTGLICEVDQRCATPEPGDTCAGAIALTGALPIQVSGSTESGFGDDYTICSDATDAFGNPVGELSPDVVPVTAAMMSAMMGPVPEDDREVHEDRVHRMR